MKFDKIDGKSNLYKSADQINNNITKLNNNNKSLQNLYNAKGVPRERPQFITTVPSGVFLDPPHEIAILLGLAKRTDSSPSSQNSLNSSETVKITDKPLVMYSYSSRPKVLNNRNYHADCTSGGRRVRSIEMNNGTVSYDRRDLQQLPYGNIMFDRRVVRGSMYANFTSPAEGLESQAKRRQEARRRAMARKKAKGFCAQGRMGTPPPVCGRQHEPVQTERYLEEIFDRPLETESWTQTDLFMDRPATPEYVPAKTGLDETTQIWPGELFDFDVEVVPILEVLVGKTVEQAMIEVLQEDELANIRAQQRRFLELRAAEKAEQERLEEQERRLVEEKERRIVEYEEALKLQKETEERVAAAMLSEGYIADLIPNVLDGLKDAGFLKDEIKEDVEKNFMPWLMREVKEELTKMVSSRDILGEIIREILENKADTYQSWGDHFAEIPREMPGKLRGWRRGKGGEARIKLNL
ncbi:UNVERIFIED_CONTAM: hypothetical protein PYX00_009283 [Menopon gallinae]|uniref:Radial spoke head protein 3 homolog n=1 Tax=Menopon gallinae TaxID=328185 RepID=A0AAW2HBC7_9NEOP